MKNKESWKQKEKEVMHDDSLNLYSIPSALDILLHLILQQSYEVLRTIRFLKVKKMETLKSRVTCQWSPSKW